MQIPKLGFTTENITLSNILSISWKFFTENFKSIIAIVLIVYIPIDIIIYYINSVPDISLKDSIKFIGWIESLIGIIATLAIAILLTKKMSGEEVGVRMAFEEAMKSWGKVVGTNIITGLMTGLLMLLLIIPGIIFGIYWTFVTFAVLFYGYNGSQARDHSKSLVVGRWWKTFFILFVIVFLPNIGLLILSLLYYMGIEMLGIDTTTIGIYGTFLIDMINNISYDIIYSYFTVCSFVLFVAYESIYAPPADVIEEKVPLDKVSEAN